MNSRVVFLDRDGVINREGGDYVDRPEDLDILPGALEAIAGLNRAGWAVIIYTNQSGVGRGMMTVGTLQSIHEHLRCLAAEHGGEITAIYACIHAPDAGCDCRKPRPGMLLQAAREHGLDLASAYAVGDSPRDIAAGQAAGCRTVLVLTGHTKDYPAPDFPDPQPQHIFDSLAAFASWLLAQPVPTPAPAPD